MTKIFLRNLLAASAITFSMAAVAAPAALPSPSMAALDIKPLDKPLHMKFCIFDLVGTQGDVFSYAKDLVLQARKWNLFVELKAYTDERVAAEDFKAGQCDGVAISTLRSKQFNFFMGSLDSVGALPSYKHMRAFIQMFGTNEKLNELSISGPYQTVAIVPLGAAYVMVNDRKIDSIEKAAGKKVAVLEWDKSQARMVQQLGAQPVASDITNFAGKFNNGQVDIIAAPAVAFKPLELYRGLGTKGAIFRLPMIQITGSVMIRRDKFKDVPDFDNIVMKLRQYGASQVETVFGIIDKSEKEIDARYWLDLSPAETEKYTKMMREARLQLTAEGVYDKRMMQLLKRIRCKSDPGNYECALKDE
ncbi:MAG: DUF6091 family protein [Moraxellaceae bacterium]|nr:DUF6091 family protein [Moraxellaceae bacterium]